MRHFKGQQGDNAFVGTDHIYTVSYFSSLDGVDVDLSLAGPQHVSADQGNDSFIRIYGIIGSHFADTLIGGADANYFLAGWGDDYIDGGGGTDRVDYALATAGISIDLNLTTSQFITEKLGSDTLVNVESIIGGNFSDNVTGTSAANSFLGGHGNDTFFGGGGADFFDGGNDTDLFYGGDGDDSYADHAGADTAYGGDGNDTMRHDFGHAVLYGGNGNDYFAASRPSTFSGGGGDDDFWGSGCTADYGDAVDGVVVNATNTTSRQFISNTQGNDFFHSILGIRGSEFNDSLTGQKLLGRSGDDLLIVAPGGELDGGTGNDTLVGGSGSSSLNGSEGNDRIEAGTGPDTLIGGSGVDLFVFGSISDTGHLQHWDTVWDFESSTDTLDISGLGANLDFIGSRGFTGQGDGEVRYVKASGTLFGDVDGDGQADFEILFHGHPILTSGDIVT